MLKLFQQAVAAHRAGHLAEAEKLYRRVIRGAPRQFPPLVMLASLKAQQGQYEDAEPLFADAVRLNPTDLPAQLHHANVLLALQRFAPALAAFERVLALDAGLVEAQLNRGGLLMVLGRPAEALAAFEAVIAADPSAAAGHSNRGNALEALHRFEDALAAYDRALTLAPRDAGIHANRANALHKQGRHEEALAALDRALGAQPDHAALHLNRANILASANRPAEAAAAYDKAFALDPGIDFLEGDRFFARLTIGDWRTLAADEARLVARVAASEPAARPFAFLTARAPQAAQVRAATTFADREFPARPALSTGPAAPHERLRVAYLSGDFREHPVAHLMAGVIAAHDRSGVETIGLSYGADDGSRLRARLAQGFERFIDVRAESDEAIATLMREAEVDIAVDLTGPMLGARPGILAFRPAPVQMLYLGYAGSSGAPYIDYLLADTRVVPETEAGLFREKLLYLPECLMPADDTRPIAAAPPSRAAEGLPESGFVFCSFNNSYKITPPVFDVWMRLLSAVEGSVLWLSRSNETAEQNFRDAARARGIAAERIVFTRRVADNADHLARHRLADLFIDTAPISAHSTASDALWAGLPLVTIAGDTFPGRIAASQLKTLGLGDLVAPDLAAYETLALSLARDPDALRMVRERLAMQRQASPLFDTRRFTRHLEDAFSLAMDRQRRGQPPATIHVPARPR